MSLLSSKRAFQIYGGSKFTYKEIGGGWISVNPAWVAENIVTVKTKLLGLIRVHRKLATVYPLILNEVYTTDKLLVNVADFNSSGGTLAFRHMRNNPAYPLSLHAVGAPIDLNVMFGKDGAGGQMNIRANSWQPPKLIEIFEKYGFECGSKWRRFKDGMHFQPTLDLALGNFRLPSGNQTSTNNIKVIVNDKPVSISVSIINGKAWGSSAAIDKIFQEPSHVDIKVSIVKYIKEKFDSQANITYNSKQKKLYIYSHEVPI